MAPAEGAAEGGAARRGRWGRREPCATPPPRCEAPAVGECCHAADGDPALRDTSSEEGPLEYVPSSEAVLPSVAGATVVADADRTLYTIGTWRVSREMYLWHLSRLGVRMVVDVRGNPRAGRQEDLHRGRELTRALQGAGIRYEYWGDRLGEEQVEALGDADLQRSVKGMLAASAPGPLCLLGHMHEPEKCHRLRLADLVPAEWRVLHLSWPDHHNVACTGHTDAKARCTADADFFMSRLRAEGARREAERRRAAEELAAAGVGAATRTPSSSSWRGSSERRRRVGQGPAAAGGSDDAAAVAKGEAESHVAAAQFAAAAALLPRLVWEDVHQAEWEERLRDGQAYRLILPWDTELLWYPRFLSEEEATALERQSVERITFHHPTYLFQTPSGVVEEKINRKGQAKICDDFNFRVQYTSKREQSEHYEVMPFEPWSKHLLHKVEGASESVFNAIWFNHYRDGTVTIQWHADGDEGLGPNAVIGSLSLGSARTFGFKSKRPFAPLTARAGGRAAAERIVHLNFPLFHGSLLVMGRNSQTHWLHSVPAMEGVRRERTNLTFRFYAHRHLEVASDKGVASAEREAGHAGVPDSGAPAAPAAPPVEADASAAAPSPPPTVPRILLVPSSDASRRIGEGAVGGAPALRSVLVDAPRSPYMIVGAFARSVADAVLPVGVGRLWLAAPAWSPDGGSEAGARQLSDDEPLLPALSLPDGSGAVRHAVLFFATQAPPSGGAGGAVAPASRAVVGVEDLEPLGADDAAGGEDLRRELASLPVERYAPPPIHLAPVPLDGVGCWVREVLTCLSGVQRKSRGRGGLSRLVFHRSSEFVALYVARPKCAVHLIATPVRLLRRRDVGASEAPLVRRLGRYAEHLMRGLRAARPDLCFAAGLRVRPGAAGAAGQLHVHVISLDLVPPRPCDLERRHLEDFTLGPSHFLPLEELARRLADGKPPPTLSLDEMVTASAGRPLACHRCGHLFGDAFGQLCRHLGRCDVWPPDVSAGAARDGKKGPPPADGGASQAIDEVRALRLREVEQLEEMGFGACGRDTLLAALEAEGSLERAVAVLAVQ